MTERFIASRPTDGLKNGLKEWASQRALRSIATTICMWATGAARYSKSARRAKFLFLRRWSRRSRHITWRFIRTANCTRRDRQLRVSIAYIAFRRTVKLEFSFAGSAGRKV